MRKFSSRQSIQTNKPFLVIFLFIVIAINVQAQDREYAFLQTRHFIVKGDQYYPPYEFINGKGEPDGFNVELFSMIANDLGISYQLELSPWDQVRTELEAGEIDVLMGVLVSPERAEKISFGIPHAVMTHGIFTRKDHVFKSLEELRDKEVIVQNKDRMHDYLIETGLTGKIIPVADQLEALRLLSSGKHDAALLGNFQGLHLIRQDKLKNIIITSSDIEPQKYAMAVSAGNDELLWLLNMGLYNLKASGEYDRLYNKWFTVYEDRFFVRRNKLPIILVLGIILLLSVFAIVMRIRIKAVKRQLMESEARYHSVFKNNHAVMLIIDPVTGAVTDANPAAENFYGYSMSKLLQMKISDINILDPEEMKANMKKAQEANKNYFEFKHRLASGEIRDVEVYSGEIFFSGRIYLYSIVHDATAKREAENKTKQWHSLLQYIIRHDPNSIAVLDNELRYVFVSDGFIRDYRLEEQDITSKRHYEIFPEIPEKWREVHRRALQGEVLSNDDDYFVRPDGTVEYTRWECRPWHTYQGKIGGIILYTEVITQRKEIEKEHQQTANRLKLVLKHAGDGIFAVDTEGKTTMINKAALEMLGVKEAERIGNLMHDYHHHSRKDGTPYLGQECPIYQAFREGKVQTVDDEVFWRKDGSSFPVEYVTTPIIENKTIHGAVVSFRDITERKKMETELRQKNEFIQTVLDNLPIGVALNKFNEGEAIYMNKKFEEIYGWGKDVLKNIESFFKHVYPDENYRKELIERVMADINSGDPARMHWEGVIATRGDCNKRIVNAVNIPLIEQNTMVSTAVDVTEQKEAEAEVVRLNNALFHLIETINELSKATGFAQVQRIVAAAAKKITGADGAAFVYKEGDYCYYADEQAIKPLWKGLRFPLEQCITGWVMLNKEPAIIKDVYKDHRIPHEVYKKTFVKSLAAFPVNIIKPVAAIAIYWRMIYEPDTIEIKLMQTLADAAAIALDNVNMYLELDNKVMERTAQLEAANKELEAFSYSVSHDLRAPLRAIDGYTKILLEDNAEHLDDDGRRVCNVIRTNTRKMGKLIDDLLAFSRLSRYEMQQSVIDMKILANSIFHEVTNAEIRSRIDFIVDDIQQAHGDPTMIRQLWINLIGNAVKYSSRKEKAIINVGGSAVGNFYEYCIRDNGVGFDMQYVKKLFGVFQRLHSEKEFEGTGVGLAIVQRVVHRHGGQVRAEGKVGEGATFYFSLPL
jgi:PAS domain S-box-containing protein